MVAVIFLLGRSEAPLRERPQRYLIANGPLEEMRLLNRFAAKWARSERRARRPEFVGRMRGCLRLSLRALWSKHNCPTD
jgi:hypothetical protein